MGAMQDRRVRHPRPPRQRVPELPAPLLVADKPVDPYLWQLFQELEFGPGFWVEFIDGQIVVRGRPALWHDRAAGWLSTQLNESCEGRGWWKTLTGGIEQLPAPAISICPDLLVFDPEGLRDEESDIPPSHVRLVAEVVSKGSKRRDRMLKPLTCARAGIPLYLFIDRYVRPLSVSLFSEPGSDGYRRQEQVPAGPGGGKLAIPEPFGTVLDLAGLPLPRRYP